MHTMQRSQIEFYEMRERGPFDFVVIDTRTGNVSESVKSWQEVVILRARLAVRNMMEDSAGTDKADRVNFEPAAQAAQEAYASATDDAGAEWAVDAMMAAAAATPAPVFSTPFSRLRLR